VRGFGGSAVLELIGSVPEDLVAYSPLPAVIPDARVNAPSGFGLAGHLLFQSDRVVAGTCLVGADPPIPWTAWGGLAVTRGL